MQGKLWSELTPVQRTNLIQRRRECGVAAAFENHYRMQGSMEEFQRQYKATRMKFDRFVALCERYNFDSDYEFVPELARAYQNGQDLADLPV